VAHDILLYNRCRDHNRGNVKADYRRTPSLVRSGKQTGVAEHNSNIQCRADNSSLPIPIQEAPTLAVHQY